MAETSLVSSDGIESPEKTGKGMHLLEVNNVLNNSKRRKTRHRNRKLYSDILRQVEFYFSDSNLHKDKFIHKNMRPGGCK